MNKKKKRRIHVCPECGALLKPRRIFSGKYSADMWDAINNARSKRDLRWALYLVCCRLQEFENRI